MARKVLVYLGIIVFALSVASPGFAAKGSAMKGTVSKIEGNQITITLDKEQTTLKEGDMVSVSPSKAAKAKSKKTGAEKTGTEKMGTEKPAPGGAAPPAGK